MHVENSTIYVVCMSYCHIHLVGWEGVKLFYPRCACLRPDQRPANWNVAHALSVVPDVYNPTYVSIPLLTLFMSISRCQYVYSRCSVAEQTLAHNINVMGSHEQRRDICRVCSDILVDGMKRRLFESAAERWS